MKSLKELFDLGGKTALITGGSRGLGRDMAQGFAEAGCNLFLLARREQWLTPTLEEFRAAGHRCEGMVCDVAKPAEVQEAVDRTVAAFGAVEILVNNAGVSWSAPAETMPLEKWQMVVDINLTGAFLFCQAAGREMLKRGYGRIINIASINGVQGGLPMHDIPIAGYAASKAGLIGLTHELAAKWGPRGIRVNAIAPGYFHSRMTEKIWEQAESLTKSTPLGRGGNEDELKGVAVFLAADASNYITGQTIVVDGGMILV